MIITIDGPSGTGKTTVARQVAEALNFVYFDTGAMYRAFTWLVLQSNVDIHDLAGMDRLLRQFDFKIIQKDKNKQYFVNGQDVTQIIRTSPITAHVSAVSALAQVRAFLLEFQHSFGEQCNAVFEGRDLGSVVFPKAEVKIFLDADPQVRAERRLSEIIEKNPQEARHLSKEQMLADLMRRDEHDSTREVAPLCCPDDAHRIDTTQKSIDEVVGAIIAFVHQKFPKQTPL